MNGKTTGLCMIGAALLFSAINFFLGFIFPEANPVHQKLLYCGCFCAAVLGLLIFLNDLLESSVKDAGSTLKSENQYLNAVGKTDRE